MVIGIDASRGNLAQRTGTEWYSYHLIRALTTVIPPSDTVILYVKEPLRPDWGPLPPHWSVRTLGWAPKLLWTQLRLSWEMLWHRPQVLFIPAHTLPLIHPKTILVAHDMGFERMEELYGHTRIGSQSVLGTLLSITVRILTFGRYGTSELDYQRWSMRYAVRHAAQLITISEFSKNEILHFYPAAAQKLRVIWHALPPEKRDNSQAPGFSMHSEKPLLLYVGRIEQKKNLLILLEALAKIPPASRPYTVLIGRDGEGAEKIHSRIQKLDLSDSVDCPGWLPEEQVQFVREHATAIILPSVYEGFGLPILEAWRAKKPIIVSHIPALREVGGDAVLSFQVDSADSCAQAIQHLCSAGNIQEDLVKKGTLRLKLFDLHTTAQKTYAAIQACATLGS